MSYLLGSDPELVLLEAGNLQSASDIINGYDHNGVFGIDGAGVAAEIRPRPANDPLTAMANIREALHDGLYVAEDYEWQAGTGEGYHPLGGHIHLGLFELTPLDIRKLTAYIGVPLLALEPEEGRLTRRRDHGYGRMDDVRRQDWGFEYRAPSSWLVSPATARIAMALSYLVARNIKSLPAVTARELSGLTSAGYETDESGREHYIYEMAPQEELIKRGKKALSILCKLKDAKEVLHINKAGRPIRCIDLLRPWYMIAEVLGDWNELRDIKETWQLVPKPQIPTDASPPPPKTEQQIFEGERHEHGWDNALVWNEGDNNMSRVRRACGNIGSKSEKIWVVGARKNRGDKLLLSPSLFANADIREQLGKMCIPFKQWPNYPARNGDHVIGLSASLREADVDLAAAAVRYIAMAALGRVLK